MISRIANCSFIAALVAVALVSACGADPSATKPVAGQVRQFSAEDKRIARQLSLGNNSLLSQTSDPQRQALLCRDTLEAIEARLASTGALNGEALKALQSAKLFYENQAGKNADGAAGPRGTEDGFAASENPSQADAGRTALACLQRLQDIAGAR